MFMFCALPLYVVYAVAQGCSLCHGGIDSPAAAFLWKSGVPDQNPHVRERAGLTGDLINFVICVVVFFAVGYAVAYFMIGKFRFATPGRLGNYTDDGAGDESPDAGTGNGNAAGKDSQAERIIGLLGGRENISFVDACMTRLRVTVKDVSKVAELTAWKAEGAMGLIKKDEGFRRLRTRPTC